MKKKSFIILIVGIVFILAGLAIVIFGPKSDNPDNNNNNIITAATIQQNISTWH